MSNFVCTHLKSRCQREANAMAVHDFRCKDVKHLRTAPSFNAVYYTPDGEIAGPIDTGCISDDAGKKCLKSLLKGEISDRIDRQWLRRIKSTIDAREADEHRKQSLKEEIDWLVNSGRRLSLGLATHRGMPIKNWFVSGTITYSPEGIADVPIPTLARTAQQSLKRICAELNVNPVYLVMHHDEKTPHFHYLIEGTDKDTGRAVASRINIPMLRLLQDIVGEEVADLGLVRGVPVQSTHANHMTMLESHREELKKELAKVEAAKAERENVKNAMEQDIETGKKALKTLENDGKTALETLKAEQNTLEKAVSDLKTELKDGKTALETLKTEQNAVTQGVESGLNTLESLRKELEAKRSELKSINETLRTTRLTMEKRRKADAKELKDLDRDRRTLRDDKKALQVDIKDLNTRIEALTANLGAKTDKRRALNEEIKALEHTKAVLDEYKGYDGVTEALEAVQAENRALKAYIEERELTQDFEDWAADYKEAQAEQPEENEEFPEW